jgi:uncharacterized protein (DUF433 family)
VPVRTLIDHLEAGDPLEVFLEDFPGVTREQAVGFLELAYRELVAPLDRSAEPAHARST